MRRATFGLCSQPIYLGLSELIAMLTWAYGYRASLRADRRGRTWARSLPGRGVCGRSAPGGHPLAWGRDKE